MWMLTADSYPDYDQYEVYGSSVGAAQPLPPGPSLTAEWANTLARRAVFRGFGATDACVRRRLHADATYSAGWQETLAILSAKRSVLQPGEAGRTHPRHGQGSARRGASLQVE